MAEPASAVPAHPPLFRTILAGLIGNVMEWYDFAVYGYFAAVIGHLFFPSEDPSVSLIAAFGAFAAGFVVRPLGGLVFGYVGDKVGRKRALTLSVICMAVPTVAIAFVPSHAEIGVMAPLLIVCLRILQGLSVGGEYTSSLIFMVEQAPPKRKAFTGVWGVWGAVAGILLGSLVGLATTTLLGEADVAAWGWRVPFLLGALVAVAGVLLRRSIHVDKVETASKSPVREAFGRHRGRVVQVALLNIGQGVGFYAAFVYAVTYIHQIDNMDEALVFDLNSLTMALMLAVLPLAALLADKIGRWPVMLLGYGILAFGAMPFFWLMHHTDPLMVFCGEAGFAVAVGLVGGGIVAANVELIPEGVRCTGLAVAYNAAVGLFGGTTPMMAAWLISTTGHAASPGWWVAGAAAISLAATAAVGRQMDGKQVAV